MIAYHTSLLYTILFKAVCLSVICLSVCHINNLSIAAGVSTSNAQHKGPVIYFVNAVFSFCSAAVEGKELVET